MITHNWWRSFHGSPVPGPREGPPQAHQSHQFRPACSPWRRKRHPGWVSLNGLKHREMVWIWGNILNQKPWFLPMKYGGFLQISFKPIHWIKSVKPTMLITAEYVRKQDCFLNPSQTAQWDLCYPLLSTFSALFSVSNLLFSSKTKSADPVNEGSSYRVVSLNVARRLTLRQRTSRGWDIAMALFLHLFEA